MPRDLGPVVFSSTELDWTSEQKFKIFVVLILISLSYLNFLKLSSVLGSRESLLTPTPGSHYTDTVESIPVIQKINMYRRLRRKCHTKFADVHSYLKHLLKHVITSNNFFFWGGGLLNFRIE